MSFVKFENVSLAYNNSEQLAIKDINFSINENEFVALVGPSGCGKSTFMKLTSGLLSPSEGYVFVNKREVVGPQKCVGMAFQADAPRDKCELIREINGPSISCSM